MNEVKKIQYPYQVGSIKRAKKVLGVDAQLYLPTEKENVNPLEIHSGYSRFVVTIVDKENNITPTANIPANELPYIKKMAELAMAKKMLYSGNTNVSSGSSESNTSSAYTVKLKDRNFSGQTPAEILIKDPGNKEKLLSVQKWLNDNVARYPGNKMQIDAIQNAMDLLETGKLNPSDVKPISSTIEVYRTDYKFKSKKNEKGYNLVYGISIICDPAKDYPFCVNITNCYAPVESYANGQKNIKMQAAEDTVKSSILMGECEFYTLINRMDATLTNFENMFFPQQYQIAVDAGYHHE